MIVDRVSCSSQLRKNSIQSSHTPQRCGLTCYLIIPAISEKISVRIRIGQSTSKLPDSENRKVHEGAEEKRKSEIVNHQV